MAQVHGLSPVLWGVHVPNDNVRDQMFVEQRKGEGAAHVAHARSADFLLNELWEPCILPKRFNAALRP